MDSHDRYVLAIAMLDNDRDARKVLADLLWEQGERGLAQWARQGSNTKLRRLDFALMLLPCRPAIGLAVVFLEHAFKARADNAVFAKLTTRMLQWNRGVVQSAELLPDCQALIAGMPSDWGVLIIHSTYLRRPRARSTGLHNPNLKVAIESLVAAVTCAIRAEEAQTGDAPSGTPRHWESMALLHLRAVARASQNQALPARSPTAATPAPTEIDWQIEQTKTQFQRLLSGDDPWPK